jgi:hypothetical protein
LEDDVFDVIIFVAGEYFYFMFVVHVVRLLAYFLIFKYFRAHPSPSRSERRTSYLDRDFFCVIWETKIVTQFEVFTKSVRDAGVYEQQSLKQQPFRKLMMKT